MLKTKVAPEKVAIYIRWSTEDQGQGHTLEIQRESCRYYALSQGWTVRDDLTFIDEGYSGSNLTRPALALLREAVKACRVDCVVVYKLDRLSRNIKDIINLVLDEWEGRCCVRSTQEPVDTTTDAGKMFFTMLGSFADFERATIRTRTWSGKLKNAEKGRNPGVPYPYGLCKGDDGHYALLEAEAAVVREIFDMYAKGRSCRAIALALNERGVRTRGGRGWSDAHVSKILRNPLYIGRLVYNREAHAQGQRTGQIIMNDPDQVIVVDQVAPAIVDPETWEQVQRIRAGRPRLDRNGSARSQSGSFLLTGLLRCTCGHGVTGFYGSKVYKPYYYCVGAQKKGRAICAAGMIQAPLLERLVVDRVRQTWPLKGGYRADLFASIGDQLHRHESVVRTLQVRLDALTRSLERFKADYKAGKLTADMYTEVTDETRAERDLHLAKLREAESNRQQIMTARGDLSQSEGWFARLDDWETLQQHERRQVLQMLIGRIQVFRTRKTDELSLHIDWRLPEPTR